MNKLCRMKVYVRTTVCVGQNGHCLQIVQTFNHRNFKQEAIETKTLSQTQFMFPSLQMQIMDQEQYYLWLDNHMLVDLIRTAIAYLRSNWKKLGRPTMILPIMKLMLGDPAQWDKNPMWNLIEKMRSGYVRGITGCEVGINVGCER